MTQISGTEEKHTSSGYKSPSPAESLNVNYLQWIINGRKGFYNKISKEVVF